ncbi:7300_t:CDS:1, partial [Ambispora leptoticha]
EYDFCSIGNTGNFKDRTDEELVLEPGLISSSTVLVFMSTS